jgi:hypothetical protein
VTGSFVVSADGELSVHAMPGDLDEAELMLTARRVARILQCGAANGVQGEEALFDFGAGKLLVREFIGGYLCVLCEGRVEMRGLRLTARLVARGMPRDLPVTPAHAG